MKSADERTRRRVAEQQQGGVSSQESAARYARGEVPAGTHRKGARHDPEDEGPAHQRPEQEEPQARVDRMPGGEKHMPATRRG